MSSLAFGLVRSYLVIMSAAYSHHAEPPETEQVRTTRHACEAAMIAHARAQVAAGQTVTVEAFDEWVASLGTPGELPLPRAR